MKKKNDRAGHRQKRSQSFKPRTPQLGYYIIVTNAKETEKRYFEGFRDSIPQPHSEKIVLRVIRAETKDLIAEAERIVSNHPKYGEPWIILDRDQEENFDKLVDSANKAGIHVGWSNPCFEIWLCAYLGIMPSVHSSVSCCSHFTKLFFQHTGKKYKKSDPSVYRKIVSAGDENKAISIAKRVLDGHRRNGLGSPSTMCPGTSVHLLIKEIRAKTTCK